MIVDNTTKTVVSVDKVACIAWKNASIDLDI
jgi:hypothetical protein